MDLKHVIARRFEPTHQSWDWRDAALYALGLGMGDDPIDEDELAYVFEGRDQRAAPGMGVMLGWPPLRALSVRFISPAFPPGTGSGSRCFGKPMRSASGRGQWNAKCWCSIGANATWKARSQAVGSQDIGGCVAKLILIRHGTPDEGHKLQPQDPPLNETGRQQAARIAERLADEGIHRIVSSPQRRAQNTAAPLAGKLGLSIELLEGLAEVDRYTDRYRSPETIRRENPESWEDFQKSPARFFGRDEEEFRSGVLGAFSTIVAHPTASRTAVFTHGMPIKTLLMHILNLTTPAKFAIGHCSVTRIAGGSIETLRVESVNETLI